MWDVDRGGGWIYVGTGGLWEMSVLSNQFYDEPRTSLEIKSIFLKSGRIPQTKEPRQPLEAGKDKWILPRASERNTVLPTPGSGPSEAIKELSVHSSDLQDCTRMHLVVAKHQVWVTCYSGHRKFIH